MNREYIICMIISLTILIFTPSIGVAQKLNIYPEKRLSVIDTLELELDFQSLIERGVSIEDIYYNGENTTYILKVSGLEINWYSKSNTGGNNNLKVEWLLYDSEIHNNLQIELKPNKNGSLIFSAKMNQPLYEFVNLKMGDFLNSLEFQLFPSSLNADEIWFIDNRKFDISTRDPELGNPTYSGKIVDPLYLGDKSSKKLEIRDKKIENNISDIAKSINQKIREYYTEAGIEKEEKYDKSIQNIKMDDFSGDLITDAIVVFHTPIFSGFGELSSSSIENLYKTVIGVLIGKENEGDSLEFELTQRFDFVSEGSLIIVEDLDADGDLDVIYDTDVYHGLEENSPDAYRDSTGQLWGFRPTYLLFNNGQGEFRVDSLFGTYDGTRPYLETSQGDSTFIHMSTTILPINIDNDPEIELVDKAAGDYISIWDYQDGYILNSIIPVIDVLGSSFIDVNNDAIKDLVLHKYNAQSDETIISVKYALDIFHNYSESEKILASFKTLQYQGYEGAMSHFNIEDEKYLFFWLNRRNRFDTPPYVPVTENKIYKLVNESLLDVSLNLLPDSLALDMIYGLCPPEFKDINNDGHTDIYKVPSCSFHNGSDPTPNYIYMYDPESYSYKAQTYSKFHYPDLWFTFFDIDSDNISELYFIKQNAGGLYFNTINKFNFKEYAAKVNSQPFKAIGNHFDARDELISLASYYSESDLVFSFYDGRLDSLYSISESGVITFRYPRSSGRYEGEHKLQIDVENKASIYVQPVYVRFDPVIEPLITPELTAPLDGQEDVGREVEFEWSKVDSAVSYHLQISSNNAFSSFIFELSDIDSNVYKVTQPLESNSMYYWRVKALSDSEDLNSKWSDSFSFTTGIRTTIEEPQALPMEFSLEQNYPNPFNPVTQIRFSLPVSTTVRLEVFTILGQPVLVLTDGQLGAGVHTLEFDGSGIASGVYLYKLTTPEFTKTRVMNLLK